MIGGKKRRGFSFFLAALPHNQTTDDPVWVDFLCFLSTRHNMPNMDQPCTRVFRIPELFATIVQFMDPTTLHSLRAANKTTLLLCAPYFSLKFNVHDLNRYPSLEELFEATLSISETDTGTAWHPLDQVQILKFKTAPAEDDACREQRQYRKRILSALNSCRNLRYVYVGDTGRGKFNPDHWRERSFYPARLIWPMGTSTEDNTISCPENDQGDEEKEEDLFPWSQWDILPLEGQLLNRLESLKLGQGLLTPMDLDRFMNRLRHSSAAETLRSLEIVGKMQGSRSVSFEALRDCVCDLRKLAVFVIESVNIRRPVKAIETQDEPAEMQKGGLQQPQRLPPTVKTLSMKCWVGRTVKMAIVELFSNVEFLTIDPGRNMWEAAEDLHVFTNTISSSVNSDSSSDGDVHMNFVTSEAGGTHLSPLSLCSVPLPKLRRMDITFNWLDQYTGSQLLQTWIARRKPGSLQEKGGFELVSICLPFTRDREYHLSMMNLVKILTQDAVTVSSIQISSDNEKWIIKVLTSRFCQNLQELLLQSEHLNSSKIIKLAFLKAHDPSKLAAASSDPRTQSEKEKQQKSKQEEEQEGEERKQEQEQEQEQEQVWKMSREDLLAALSWARTLTRLCLKFTPDCRSDVDDAGPSTLVFTRSFLRLLPRLIDLEMSESMMDLSMFEGLGRDTAPQISLDAADCSQTESNCVPWVNYCLTETPLLERLQLYQSCKVGDPLISPKDRIDSWREHLLFKFRFLKDLHVSRSDRISR